MFEHITASEIAGYGVGAMLVCATISAPKIDSFISTSQRRSLGLCKKCGDLRMIVCSTCKGSGAIKQPTSNFNFNLNLNLLFDEQQQQQQPFEGSKLKSFSSSSSSCVKCQGRGHFRCPECNNNVFN